MWSIAGLTLNLIERDPLKQSKHLFPVSDYTAQFSGSDGIPHPLVYFVPLLLIFHCFARPSVSAAAFVRLTMYVSHFLLLSLLVMLDKVSNHRIDISPGNMI